jgi:hypothetical protein
LRRKTKTAAAAAGARVLRAALCAQRPPPFLLPPHLHLRAAGRVHGRLVPREHFTQHDRGKGPVLLCGALAKASQEVLHTPVWRLLYFLKNGLCVLPLRVISGD